MPSLHRRQLVIGPAPLPVADGWVERPLGDDLWATHCPDLDVVEVDGADGTRWLLAGLAVECRPGAPDPPAALAALQAADVGSVYESWAGRWLLFGNGCVHLDAAGQLGCHWLAGPDKPIWVSTSPAILAPLSGAGPEAVPGHRLVYEQGLSWYAPPLDRRSAVRRLLPSQILDVARGTTRARPLLPSALPSDREAVYTALAEALVEPIRRLSGDGLSLGLTAGADSRLVLAAAVVAGVELDAFTRRAARMSVGDRVLPPRLAASVDVDHRELRPRPSDRALWALARAHSDDHVSAGDAQPFVQRSREALVGRIELGGQGFGVGKVTNRDLPATIDDPDSLAEAMADRFGESSTSPNRRALAAWLSTVIADPADASLDWRDRFYIEQRMAGWQASKEQVYDLDGHRRFFPVNAARTYGLLLALDEEERRTGAHQIELIRRLEPRLLTEPVNPPGSSFSLPTRVLHRIGV